MICPSCNTPNRNDAKFCKRCGQPLPAEAEKMPANVGAPIAGVAGDSASAAPVPAQGGTESARSQENTGSIEVTAGNTGLEDPAIEPTQILTPEQMLAYHQRRWQQETEQEQQNAQAASPAPEMPALPTGSESSPPQQNHQPMDVADVPTVIMTPEDDSRVPVTPPSATAEESLPEESDEPMQAPPPPPQSSVSAHPAEIAPGLPTTDSTGTAGEEAGATADTETVPPEAPQGARGQLEQESTGSGTSTSDFAVLPLSTLVIGRYELTQVVNESARENVYQVVDHQGYQRCWNCGSEQNVEGDEFCINCGAGLLGATYLMHEYSAASTSKGVEEKTEDAGDVKDAGVDNVDEKKSSREEASREHVLHGTIVNTFVEQGRTYMIEQPQAAQNAFPNGVQLLAASNSDAGDVRRSEPNEDSTLVLLLQRVFESLATPSGVFIVADGLGGHDSGQVASRTTINIIAERMIRELLSAPLVAEKNGTPAHQFDEDELEAMFRSAIEDANTALVQMNQRDKTDMGSTITGFMIVGHHAYVINVGDSRTYMMRGKQLYQLTTDHSLVGQLVASGLIEPDDVYTHPQRSQIFRSLGDKSNVQIDVFKQELLPGDILLSCSDGLWEMVRNPQIESILSGAPDPQKACTQLIEAANANGGEDNVSAVVVAVR